MKLHTSTLLLALAAATPVGAKLTAWYPFDESPAADAVVVENVADNAPTMIGFDPDPDLSLIERGYPSASSALGTAYRLTNGGIISLGTNPAVQPTDQFTISFFYQPGVTDAYDRIFESQDGNANTQHGIRIDGAAQGNRVRVLIRSNAVGNTQITHSEILKTDGTWYFCAVRYDSTLGDGTALKLTVLPLDGSPVDEAAITDATENPNALNTGPLSAPHGLESLLGAQNAAGTGNNNLTGALDELAFYDNSDANGVLSDAALAAGANFGPSGVELITSFTSDKGAAAPGNPATFTWIINEPFDSLTLDDGNGNTTDLAPLTTDGTGSTMVSPSENTVYYLKGVSGEVENVHTIKIISGAPPEITSFTASSPIVGVGENVDLSWSVTGADTLTLAPGDTDVSALTTTTVAVNETTTFTLSATNGFGTSTADVAVTASNGPVPVHSYVATSGVNSANSWTDIVGAKNINLTGLLFDNPITTASAGTTISGTYQSAGGPVGGAVGAFQFPDLTTEVWFRPTGLSTDHQVIFETGGGQNGLAALITEDGLRFIGSAGNARTLDLVVPLSGLNLTDFVQLVFSTSTDNDTFEVSVKDTFGNTITASETADIVQGGNGAVVFNYGTGGIANGDNNLGGRTELPDQTPEGLTGFIGDIAILNIYDSILTPAEIDQAFIAVAPDVTPSTGEKNAITNITYDGANQVSLTWRSIPGVTYDAEFSTSLKSDEWFPFEQTIEATETETTANFAVPANQPRFFLRITTVAP